jgi:hypothetical protein
MRSLNSSVRSLDPTAIDARRIEASGFPSPTWEGIGVGAR